MSETQVKSQAQDQQEISDEEKQQRKLKRPE